MPPAPAIPGTFSALQLQPLARALPALGIDLDAVTAHLEAEGIQKFIGPFDRLLASVENRRAAAVA